MLVVVFVEVVLVPVVLGLAGAPLLGVAVAAAAIALYVERSRIPRPDWPFTVDVDRHLEIAPVPAGERSFWSLVLVEKVVLLSLISVIFAQVLPDIRSTNLGLAAGVAVLVVANAAVSELLRRRGRSWSTTVRQFGAMLVINVALVELDALVGSRRGDRAPALNDARDLVKGVICGIRVEELEPGTMREIRILDKLVDELAKGKPMEKILRG